MSVKEQTGRRPVRNYVDGGWVEVDASDSRRVENPATGETIAETPQRDSAAVDAIERWPDRDD